MEHSTAGLELQILHRLLSLGVYSCKSIPIDLYVTEYCFSYGCSLEGVAVDSLHHILQRGCKRH